MIDQVDRIAFYGTREIGSCVIVVTREGHSPHEYGDPFFQTTIVELYGILFDASGNVMPPIMVKSVDQIFLRFGTIAESLFPGVIIDADHRPPTQGSPQCRYDGSSGKIFHWLLENRADIYNPDSERIINDPNGVCDLTAPLLCHLNLYWYKNQP